MTERDPNFTAHQYGIRGGPPAFMLLPALFCLPWVHYPVGIDHVNLKRALLRALALMVLPIVYWQFYCLFTNRDPPSNLGHEYLVAYALLTLSAHVAVFARRVIGQRHGEDVHSSEGGYSILAWMTPLPTIVTEIVIIPACVGGAGWYAAHSFSFELGWWMVATGVSLFLLATYEEKQRFNAIRSANDALISAGFTGWRIEQHEAKKRKQVSRSNESPDVADMG